MPIDALKLDKTFIDDYEHPTGRNIIECVINMTKKLDITIIAEGIETQEQYDYVKYYSDHTEISMEGMKTFEEDRGRYLNLSNHFGGAASPAPAGGFITVSLI